MPQSHNCANTMRWRNDHVQLAQHHNASIAEAHAATEYWKQQAEQGQKILDEVNRGVASVLSEQRHVAHQDVQDTIKSKAQELTESYGKEVSEELKEQYSKLAQVCQIPCCESFPHVVESNHVASNDTI